MYKYRMLSPCVRVGMCEYEIVEDTHTQQKNVDSVYVTIKKDKAGI